MLNAQPLGGLGRNKEKVTVKVGLVKNLTGFAMRGKNKSSYIVTCRSVALNSLKSISKVDKLRSVTLHILYCYIDIVINTVYFSKYVIIFCYCNKSSVG